MSDPSTAPPGAAPAEAGSQRDAGASILLQRVTKRYAGRTHAAVAGLTLEIPAGSLVVLVGPSGCGKTTTLKMINRLIEPSSGQIIIGGRDVTRMNGNVLRRSIGYVIQAGGLFPHMTVAANVALVPRMLHWERNRISQRVDALLDLVSLDPALYRNRFPRELSGGQQQRVGVARALAADPPVLLMDEPFGAVDPITRQRLQDELIALHDELGKTIVFVTHDFEEAMKLGDWIAVFDMGARLVQYDTPKAILAQPASAFVQGFIGAGAGLKQLKLARAGDAELAHAVVAYPGEEAADVLRRVQQADGQSAVVLDSRRRPIQWLGADALKHITTIDRRIDDDLPVVNDRATLSEALDAMLVAATEGALVTGPRGALRGVLNIDSVTTAISRARHGAQDHDTPLGLNTAGPAPSPGAAPLATRTADTTNPEQPS